MEQDILAKRASFIRESTEIRETFAFASPVEVLRAVKLHAGCHYGSNLWKLQSESAEQYFAAWRTCVKLAWHVPRSTHTYFVDHLLSCSMTSVKTDILARFVKFVRGLRASPSKEVSVLCGVVAGDVQTATGNNLNLLMQEIGLDPVKTSSDMVKKILSLKMTAVPETDSWRLPYLVKLLEQRGEAYYGGEDFDQLTVWIDSLCVN